MVAILAVLAMAAGSYAAGTKVSDMPAATAFTGAELMPIVQGGLNKKATAAQFSTSVRLSLFANLSTAVNSSLTADKNIEIDTAATCNNLTVPTNRMITADYGKTITIASGKTITLNGPVTFPIEKVFAGTGAVVFGAGIDAVHGEWFGMVGDNSTDNRLPMQRAIAATSVGGVLEVGSGTFLISSHTTSYNTVMPKSGVSIYGVGKYATIFKMAAGLRTAGSGGIGFLYDHTGALANITYQDFTVDFNGVNNLDDGTGTMSTNRIGGGGGITNVTIKSCRFLNAAGHHFIYLGGSGTNARVLDNYFENCGEAITGNLSTDHTSIYMQVSNSLITGNYLLQGGTGSAITTGIETHDSSIKVVNNYVSGYHAGSYIAAEETADMKDIDYEDNTFVNLYGAAIVFFVNSGQSLSDVWIHNNYFSSLSTESTSAIISTASLSLTGTLKRVKIDDNFLQGNVSNSTAVGIGLTNSPADVLIFNNDIVDCPKTGILAQIVTKDFGSLQIRKNRFFNCGTTTTGALAAYKSSIVLWALGGVYLRDVDIVENSFANDGVAGTLPVAYVNVGNRVLNLALRGNRFPSGVLPLNLAPGADVGSYDQGGGIYAIQADFPVAYGPLWTGATNPVVGLGSLTGQYTVTGKLCTCMISITMGSNTTYGTGTWKLSLPIPMAGTSFSAVGQVYALDSNAGFVYTPVARIAAATGVLSMAINGAADVTPTVPFTWAVGDQLDLEIAYNIL